MVKLRVDDTLPLGEIDLDIVHELFLLNRLLDDLLYGVNVLNRDRQLSDEKIPKGTQIDLPLYGCFG